jgi:hypothetical protein
MFQLKLCRSHEAQNVPQAWETLSTHDTPREAWQAALHRIGTAKPAGDQLRIVGPAGDEYTPNEFPHAYEVTK